jgi:hypothetical protein
MNDEENDAPLYTSGALRAVAAVAIVVLCSVAALVLHAIWQAAPFR